MPTCKFVSGRNLTDLSCEFRAIRTQLEKLESDNAMLLWESSLSDCGKDFPTDDTDAEIAMLAWESSLIDHYVQCFDLDGSVRDIDRLTADIACVMWENSLG